MIMLCPICAEEFLPRLALCPTCGCNLVSSTFTVQDNRKDKRKTGEYVELCRPRAFPIAMLIKETLEQNGISVIIQGGHSLSMLPQLAFGGEMRLLVDSEQYEYALALYRAYFENSDGDYISDE
jgi:hypothetical protein